jgi:hypothetical protein
MKHKKPILVFFIFHKKGCKKTILIYKVLVFILYVNIHINE